MSAKKSPAKTPAKKAAVGDLAQHESLGGGTAELRVSIAVGPDEITDYTVSQVGSGDTAEGWNVTPAHDPAGRYVLPKHADSPDAAVAEFTKQFDDDKVTISGAGDAYAVVNGTVVLAVEATREKAVAASKKLSEAGDQAPGSSGIVLPATTAVKEMFDAAGTEGTRVIVRGGIVFLAR